MTVTAAHVAELLATPEPEKTCPDCRARLPWSAFYMTMLKRPFTYCKPCSAKRRRAYNATHTAANTAYAREYAKVHPDMRRKSQRMNYSRSANPTARVRRWQANNPERAKLSSWASNRVKLAIRKGLLVRPDRCEACGVTGRIEASHSDYSRPLDVRWLCVLCHRGLDHRAPKTTDCTFVARIRGGRCSICRRFMSYEDIEAGQFGQDGMARLAHSACRGIAS